MHTPHLNRIRIYSTDGKRTTFTINLDRTISFWGTPVQYDIDSPQWISNKEFLFLQPSNSDGDEIIQAINPFTNESREYEGKYAPQPFTFPDFIEFDDERQLIADQTFPNTFFNIIDNPYNTQFAVVANNDLLIGDTATKLFTDSCIQATSIVFASSGDIAISDGKQILLIQGENTYRLAYHTGTVFDWRVPTEN